MRIIKLLFISFSIFILMGCLSRQKDNPLTQLTSLNGDETRASVSPDGRKIAFQHTNNGNSDISILDLHTMKVIPFAKSKNNESVPSWSPDGKEILFTLQRERAYGLMKKNLKSGEEKEVFFEDTLQLRNPDWSSSGLIAATGLYKNKYYQWVLDPKKQSVEKMTENGDEYNGKWSPDGKSLIYYTGRNDSIMSLDIETSKLTCLSGTRYTGYYPEIGPDNNRFVFTAHIGGSQNIWMGEKQKEAIEKLTSVGYNYFPSWYNDGKSILFSHRKVDDQLYAINIKSGKLTRLTSENLNLSPAVSNMGNIALIHKIESDYYPALLIDNEIRTVGDPFTFLEYVEWSHDESKLIVTGTRSLDVQPDQKLALYTIDLKTGESEMIVSEGRLRNPVCLPDSDQVIYSARSTDLSQDLWVVNIKTKERKVLLKTAFNSFATHYDAKTKNLTYFDRVNYGSYQAYEFNIESEKISKIETNSSITIEPSWSIDKSKLVFLRRDSGQFDLSIWDSRTKETRYITQSVYRESPPKWMNENEVIFSMNEHDLDLWKLKLDGK